MGVSALTRRTTGSHPERDEVADECADHAACWATGNGCARPADAAASAPERPYLTAAASKATYSSSPQVNESPVGGETEEMKASPTGEATEPACIWGMACA